MPTNFKINAIHQWDNVPASSQANTVLVVPALPELDALRYIILLNFDKIVGLVKKCHIIPIIIIIDCKKNHHFVQFFWKCASKFLLKVCFPNFYRMMMKAKLLSKYNYRTCICVCISFLYLTTRKMESVE